MPKFTKSERQELKSMVRACSIFKLRDHEILTYIKNTSGLDPSPATLTRIKSSLKRDSVKWYDGLMSKRYEFIDLIKENWDSINELKKLTLDNYSKAEQLQNISEKRKNLELALKIEEDIADYLDALRFIGSPSATSDSLLQNSTRSHDKSTVVADQRLENIPF